MFGFSQTHVFEMLLARELNLLWQKLQDDSVSSVTNSFFWTTGYYECDNAAIDDRPLVNALN